MNASRFSTAVGSSPAADPKPGETPPGNGNQNPPPGDQAPGNGNQQTEENAVAKAYDKLRTVEEQAKTYKKENEQLKPENDNLKQENQTLKTQNETLQGDLQRFAAERQASLLGFVDSEAAVAVLVQRGSDIGDREKAKKALEDYAKEKNITLGQAPPNSGGPISPQTTTTPVGNQGMNSMIRRGAGRE